MNQAPKNPKETKNHPGYAPTSMQLLGKVWGISFAFVVSAGAGALLGWGFDHFVHTRPVGLLVGVGVGIIAGGIRFVRDAKRADAEALERPGRTPPE
ncbi:MAG: AtpZ/AtpI family protein [Phycisphaerales bacterium]|jgi:F0F1-type ATP synthase assembly protein I